MNRQGLILAAGFLFLLPLGAAAAERPPYTPEQLSLIRRVTECRIAPDGKTVAFTSDISGVVELWTVPSAGGWPNQLTNLNEQVTNIRWSPDGKWIVFTSDQGGNERRDLFRVPAAGGEVEKLTDTKLSETSPRFSPAGHRLAFTADPDKDFLFQLHVLDLATRKTVQLTREKVNVVSPVWSPDGRTIAATATGDDQKGKLLLVNAGTGAKTEIDPPVPDGILWAEAFSPDGKQLLVLARNPAGFVQMGLLRLEPPPASNRPPAVTGPVRFIGPGNWDVTEVKWTRNGLWLLRNQGGATSLEHMAAPDEKPREVVRPAGVVSHLDLDDDQEKLVLLAESPTRPADVHVLPTRLDSKPADRIESLSRQVTFSLMGGVRSEELASAEMVAYESFDRRKIHAVVVRPRVARLGTPPPAVVYVHGGPNGQTTLEFNPFFHVLAEAGIAVIAPNYRGSTGYGKEFEDANNKDWGGGDLKDLVEAVKHLGANGTIDSRRVGITGGSYGGYLTLLALSKTPTVWKAGVERYGMPDLVMDYMLSISRFGTWYETEMGTPRTHAALFRERSPLLYLDDIRSPLLIFQGAGDTNVPRAESDMLVAVLRELKKPHEYHVYDDEGHGFTRRRNLLDCYRRSRDLFVKQLGPNPDKSAKP